MELRLKLAQIAKLLLNTYLDLVESISSPVAFFRIAQDWLTKLLLQIISAAAVNMHRCWWVDQEPCQPSGVA